VTRVLLFVLLAGAVVIALARPWLGIVNAYVIAVLAPQSIWPWIFAGVRPFFVAFVPVAIGTLLAFAQGSIQVGVLKTKINLFMLVWFIGVTISFLFGPYVHAPGLRFFDPAVIFDKMFKTFVTYFFAAMLIDDRRKAAYLGYVMIFSGLVWTWWANTQYLDGRVFGRLGGPRGSYQDENVFAMVFVTTFPFVYYWALTLHRRLLRTGLLLTIPLMWHAVFLTASRGGLLGLGAVLTVIVLNSRRKMLAAAVIPLFAVAYLWQGGMMRERAATIGQYDEEQSARSRLVVWPVIIRMGLKYPLTGVGVASVGTAFRDFATTPPRVAHNTPIQIFGEWGAIAAFGWLGVVGTMVVRLSRARKRIMRRSLGANSAIDPTGWLLDATLAASVGYLACAVFLSLQTYEGFFLLVALTNALVRRQNVKLGITGTRKLQ